jgi:cholesterol transport system auxiliary component
VTSLFPARALPMLRTATIAIAVIALAGCGILPKQETLALYRPEPAIATDAAWPQASWQLQIARPYADDMHDSARILVRPRSGELQVYKGAAWTQPAPDIVLDTLLRAFADSGRFAGVARRGEGVNAQYELLLDLRRFESDYGGGDVPSARIELGARLVHNAENRVVASRAFAVATIADGSDIAQVSRAFERGLGEATAQLIGWTLEKSRTDTSASSRASRNAP